MRLLELYTTDRKMRSSWERECYFFLDVMRRHYYLMHQARDQPQTWLVRLGGGDNYLAVLYLTVILLRPQLLPTSLLYSNTLSMPATCLVIPIL